MTLNLSIRVQEGMGEYKRTRLVARAFKQRYRIYYEKPFSPLVNWAFICLRLSIVVSRGGVSDLPIPRNTFIRGVMEKNVYMHEATAWILLGKREISSCLQT
jgi:hypothetical protein